MPSARRTRSKRGIEANQEASSRPGKKPRKSAAIQETGKAEHADLVHGELTSSLDRLPELPIDVLYEIFGHLAPEDLLRLARSNKSFRNLLLSRSSAVAWRTARHNAPALPNCPPYLSEPKYASLMFESHCYNCGVDDETQTDVLWEFNVRYCKACRAAMVVLKRSDEPDLNDILVLPHASGPERRGMATYWFHLPDLIHHDEVFNQSANPPSEDFKEAYALTKAELTLQITEYAPMLRKYTAAMKKRRQQQIRTAKNKRRADICQRLRQGEFEEDIDVLTTSPHRKDWQLFSRHPLVDSTEELTHEGWDSIKSGIFQFMQDYRTRRLLVQYKHTLIHRFEVVRTAADDQRRKHDGIRPHFVDFCLLPQVRALLDIPRDKNVDQRALDQLFKTYPILAEDWRTIATNQLRAHARRQMALPLNEDQDPLKLAVAYFKCTKCNVVVLYPAALEHSCCWRWPENENSESERDVLVEPVYDDAARVAAGEYPWSCQRLEWCPWADKIEKVFQVCGLNPMATTLSRAQDLDHRVKLVCTLCRPRRRKNTMSFLDAIEHCIYSHSRYEAEETGWELPGPGDEPEEVLKEESDTPV